MGLIDSGSKSSRLLASRRYTHNTFTTAQESFTNVLDLRAEEIFTRAHLIPSSSLPYSGSSQLGLTYSTKGQSVSKYWYKQQLTKSNTNNEVWFFLNPTGSSDGVGAQLINSNQQTNFISPKYALASLATSTTEDSTPGYLAVLYKSTAVASSEETGSLGSGDIVSTNDYVFDYKTGVVQFLNSTKDPSDSEYVYMTAYQYIGDTLKSGIEIEGQVSASNLLVTDTLKAGTLISPEITLATASIAAITASVAEMKEFTNADTISGSFTALSGSVATRFDSRETNMTLATASIAAITASISRIDSEIDTNVANITLATASIAAITSSISRLDTESSLATASIAAITSSLSTISGTGELQGLGTTSSPLFNSVTASADVSASGNIYATGNLDIDGTSNFSSDVTIDSDLDVTGTLTATEIHTTFISSSIFVASGSNNFGDATDDHHSFTGSLSVSSSLSVTGSATIDGTLTVDEIGAFTAGGAIDFGDQNMTNVDIDSGDITGVTFGTTTSTIISGSTTAVSSSIATRFDSREVDMTLATASIAAITASVAEMKEFTKADTISGSFTALSGSVATRFDSREADMVLATASIAAITSSISRIDSEIDTNAANITLATASIAALTASISRLNDEISTDDTDMNLATASIAAITASISELRTHETLSTASIEAITSSIAEMKEFTKADTISGSFTSLSGSIATRFDSREVDMTLATASIAAITASVSRIDSEIDTNSANITLATASIAAITSSVAEMKEFTNATTISGSFTSVSSSIATRFDSREVDMTLATASIAALTASISRLNDEISTDDTDMNLATASIAAITASVAEMKEFTIASTISGSFTVVSSSIATRFDAREVDMTLATASIAAITASISRIDSEIDTNSANMTLATASIAAITASVAEMKEFTKATTISGSFTTVSSSIATRFDSRETDITLATASIAAITASISRLNDEISTDDTDMNLATASIAAITASVAEMKEFTIASTISGSFTSVSSSIATRFDSRETDMTLATASIEAITASIDEMKAFTSATVISGSTTALSSSIATRFDSRETDMTLATASIAAITSSISTINDNMTLATASIAAITASVATLKGNVGQELNTDSDVTFGTVTSGDITSTGTITAVEVHTTFISSSITVTSGSNIFGDATTDSHQFTGSIDVSGSFTLRDGDMTVSDTLTATNIGAFTAGGAIDFGDQNMTNVDIDSGDITGITFGTATSTIISGSTTAVSSSIATRFDSRETDMTLATASIAAITASVAEMKEFTVASTISGSFTSVSSSIATRFDARETDMTLATASIAALTASISRLNTEISTDDTDMTLATASIAAITASISRLDSEIDEAGIFDSTGSFYRTHNNIQITGSLSVSGLITGSFSGLEIGQKYKHVQTTPSNTWTVSHGFDYQYVNIDVYNGSDELVIPASVVATDSNTITISFNTTVSGVAIVSTGGQAVDELGKNVIFEQSTVSTNWRVTHSIGEQYPAVTVYDENDNVIIPERINAVDASKMDIIFTNAVSGNANISVGGGQLRNAITGSEQLSFDDFGDISGSISSTGSFGFLNVVGDAVIAGNLTFGDANTDSINLNAEINSNIIPDADNTYNLGSSSKNWRFGHIEELSATNVTASGDLDIAGIANFASVVTADAGVVVDNFTLDGTELDLSSGNFTLDVAGDVEINADGGNIVVKDDGAVLLDIASTKISGSAVSTGSFGNVNVAEMSVTSVSALSSSIASRLDSLSGDVIALSIALG